jgi:hypothetical protein
MYPSQGAYISTPFTDHSVPSPPKEGNLFLKVSTFLYPEIRFWKAIMGCFGKEHSTSAELRNWLKFYVYQILHIHHIVDFSIFFKLLRIYQERIKKFPGIKLYICINKNKKYYKKY